MVQRPVRPAAISASNLARQVRIVGRLRSKKPAEAFQRLRTLPGEQAQVGLGALRHAADWARHSSPLGVRDGAQLLAAALSSLLSGCLDAILVRGHVRHSPSGGGTPRVLLYDNLKSAVLERHGDGVVPRAVELGVAVPVGYAAFSAGSSLGLSVTA